MHAMRLLSDEAYKRWADYAQRIAFVHNTAVHEGINVMTPFAVYHGSEARDTLASSLSDPPPVSEDIELCERNRVQLASTVMYYATLVC